MAARLTQNDVEKMKETLDVYYTRYCEHQDVCEYESPQYWRAQDVLSAIRLVIEEISP